MSLTSLWQLGVFYFDKQGKAFIGAVSLGQGFAIPTKAKPNTFTTISFNFNCNFS